MLKQTKDGNYFERTRTGGTIWYGKERPARAKLTDDSNAVSPVIAVILMVAITVVLAAVVFVLVNNISQTSAKPAPQITFSREGKNLTVTQSAINVPWSDLAVSGCSSVPTAGNITAGQRITGCAGIVIIRHIPTNQLLYQDTF